MLGQACMFRFDAVYNLFGLDKVNYLCKTNTWRICHGMVSDGFCVCNFISCSTVA